MTAGRPRSGGENGHTGRVDDVRKIAALRANAIGDFVFSLPAFDALRACYPDAEIVLLAREWHARFLADRPSPIDRVIVLPPIYGVSLPGTPEHEDTTIPAAFAAAMAAERFDIAMQLHGGGCSSNPFIRNLGARLTVGMRTPDAAPLDRWIRYIYYQPEVLRYLEVVALVGAPPVTVLPRIAVTDRDRAEAERALSAASDAPLAVLHPGATDQRRRWPAQRFAQLGDRLVGRGVRVAVTGDDSERELVRSVVTMMRRPALDLAGRLSLGGLVGLLALADLVVGNDTGPLHLARAVDAPSVTIYWIGNLINGGPPDRHRHRALPACTVLCPVCGVNQIVTRCVHDPSFVEGVLLSEVEEQAFDLLELHASAASAPAPNVTARSGEETDRWMHLGR